MCELFAMSSRVPASVSFSLKEFAQHGGATGPHRDGWGIAFRQGRDVRLMREPGAASDSAYVRFVREQRLLSTLVISHIRHATQGDVALKNTQPFQRELGGAVHVFAHNGDLHGIDDRPDLGLGRFRPVGDTDSERAVCALLARLEGLWLADALPPLEQRLESVVSFAESLRELGPANFLYFDGDVLFAHGHRRRHGPERVYSPPGLYTLGRHCDCEPSQSSQSGITIETPCGPQEVTLVASVPLTDESWEPMPEGAVYVLRDGALVCSTVPEGSQ